LLQGIKIVNIGLNAPAPIAALRLARMGASVIKIEPPSGDPLEKFAAHWYKELCTGQSVRVLDLKSEKGRRNLDAILDDADLLLASFRPSALARLKLDWKNLHARHKRLCFTGIIGYHHPHEERTGHDLTYLADAGLLSPPHLPPSLYADLAGAERAVSLSLALLLNFSRKGVPGCGWVSLHECARDLAEPRRAGLTVPGGMLGGGNPLYCFYQARNGWIALAALEPQFVEKLCTELGLISPGREELERIFRTRSAEQWEQWAEERGLPLAAVRS
jgi:alpha-methylacyl-CoA racemase